MITLAIELSTDCGSLALLDHDQVQLERTWREDRSHRQQVFAELELGLSEGWLDPARVDLFAVGVGPGSFSGLRMAISAVRAMAMPDSRPVYAVASAAALAWEVMLETGRNDVVVVGDARRSECWAGHFLGGGDWPRQQGGWTIANEALLEETLGAPGSVWVTSDWERIGEKMKPGGSVLIRERRVPQARYVGLVAGARFRADVKTEELVPIYLHPAVSAPPVY
jgi:tRNA threonylcarbamoyl adenosine modification protein YeaZ